MMITVKDLKMLAKLRLSLSVVFSSLSGYCLGFTEFDWVVFILIFFGGLFMVASSNIFNQIVERKLDKLMKRTANRPLPQKRVSQKTSYILAFSLTLMGIFLLSLINLWTVFFSTLSLLIYVLIYTPLKTKTPLAVFIGAFPGAIPFMLGWVAATNKFGIEPGTLFIIQFLWQFPHFWAIGWLLDNEYKNAGFKMLPTLKKDKKTAFLIVFYTFWTIVASILPLTKITGNLSIGLTSGISITILGLIFLMSSIRLFFKKTTKSAKILLLVSIIYITFLQIIYVIDKLVNSSV